MKHTICNQVRSEIEEKELTASLSAFAVDHLRHCRDCQQFQGKETKLRQIVSSLEPVAAPADFDFRLRARLANDRTLGSYKSIAPVRVWRMRSAAVAAMLLIFAGTIYVLRQNQTVTPGNHINGVAQTDNVRPSASPIQPPTTPPEVLTPKEPGTVAVGKAGIQRRQVAAAPKRPPTSIDFGSTPAPVVSAESTASTFPLEVPQPSYKVSLDDGRGTSRTISVPSVSFGSRRVLSTNVSNPYASKGDW